MIYVDLQQDFSNPALLERAVQLTLESESSDLRSDLTIVLTDDAQLQRLNRDYLGALVCG